MSEMSVRILPQIVYELACQLYPADGPNAIRRLVDGLSEHDLRMMATIALRDGPDAALAFYHTRPRRLRVFIREARKVAM